MVPRGVLTNIFEFESLEFDSFFNIFQNVLNLGNWVRRKGSRIKGSGYFIDIDNDVSHSLACRVASLPTLTFTSTKSQ